MTDRSETPKVYFKNLDALRAIAALAVVGFHCSNGFHFPTDSLHLLVGKFLSFNNNGGVYGVSFFFILSGFLITYLIYKEQLNTGKLNVLFFYMRRILRIWPLYYLTLLVGFVIYPFIMSFMGHGYVETASPLMYVFFLGNFDIIFKGLVPTASFLGVHWSLCVEEQFYLFWPLIFMLFSKSQFQLLIYFVLFIWSEIFYWQNNDHFTLHYHLLSNLRFLVMGAFLAYLAVFKYHLLVRIVNFGGLWFKNFLYISSVAALFFSRELSLVYGLNAFMHFLPLFFFTYVIADQCFSSSVVFRMGDKKLLSSLGRISYGIYLLHMIVMYFIFNFFGYEDVYFIKTLCTFLLTIVAAHFVYRYYEEPFLKWKKKFEV